MTAIDPIIWQRRTHKQFDGSPISTAVLTELLEAAIRAPQHRLHNPWRFAVLDQAAIADLGQWLPQQTTIVNFPDPEKGAAKITKLTEHYFPQLGAMISVTQRKRSDQTEDEEDLMAVAAAVQNILLAAEARGLASFWASSKALMHPLTLRHLGHEPANERFVASIWLGGRVSTPNEPNRLPVDAVATWHQGTIS